MIAETIARELHGRKSGAGWTARCPAHEDRAPSLSIAEKDGRLLVHCHAGCDQTAVVDALRARGLWPELSPRGWTPVQRRDWARQRAADERDLRDARLFADVAHILAEQVLEELKFYDLQREPLTTLIAVLRSDGGALMAYREWRIADPKLTRALVRAGAAHQERLSMLVTNYLTLEVGRAA